VNAPRFVFSAVALLVAGLLCHLSFSTSGVTLDGTVSGYLVHLLITGPWITLPLVIAASQAVFKPSSNLDWLFLFLIILGAWADFEVGASHAALFINPFLIWTSWTLAIKSLRGGVNWVVVLVVLIFFSVVIFGAVAYGGYPYPRK
jgi:hypothetical protein